MKDTESISTAILQKEIKRLKIINAELLEACKEALETEKILMESNSCYRSAKLITHLKQAVSKAEGKE